jgi:23S rRNA (adenine2503-C2)-methyltransferase
MSPPPSIYNQTLAELETWFGAQNLPAYRAKQVFAWVYQKRCDDFRRMGNLPKSLQDRLAQVFSGSSLRCLRRTGSTDTTQKFLFALPDGNFIEAVLIPASPALYGATTDRRTICLSTQVGCAYGCKFCASGLEGWTRNLSPNEIVEQILQVELLSGEKVNNIVFMGMGEPLANFANLLRALEIVNAPWGVGIGARHITISTSGLAPRIRELAEQPLQVRLAVSLHGATDEVREKIMPVNRKYNIAALMEACAAYRLKKHQRITFEYILINDVNDQLEQAFALARLAKTLEAKINLIPYNHVDGLPWQRPSLARQHAFLHALRARKIAATIRLEKGHDIEAACGQLRLHALRDKSFAGV